MMRMALLVGLVAGLLTLSSCGVVHGTSAARMMSRPDALPSSCLRLRGGFFKLPGPPASGGGGGGARSGETATEDDFKDADDAAPGSVVATTPQQQDAAAAAAGGPAVTVQQHVAEYALAGSLDGEF
jgi:hypothetical protein